MGQLNIAVATGLKDTTLNAKLLWREGRNKHRDRSVVPCLRNPTERIHADPSSFDSQKFLNSVINEEQRLRALNPKVSQLSGFSILSCEPNYYGNLKELITD